MISILLCLAHFDYFDYFDHFDNFGVWNGCALGREVSVFGGFYLDLVVLLRISFSV